jgi:hypothetical protein
MGISDEFKNLPNDTNPLLLIYNLVKVPGITSGKTLLIISILSNA